MYRKAADEGYGKAGGEGGKGDVTQPFCDPIGCEEEVSMRELSQRRRGWNGRGCFISGNGLNGGQQVVGNMRIGNGMIAIPQ